MSSPYLASLGQQQNYRPGNHYQGESWDLSAGSSLNRLSHTMSSSALERLGDPYEQNNNINSNNYRSNSLDHHHTLISSPPSSLQSAASQLQSTYRSLPPSHSPYQQDNYGQYTDLGYSSGHSSSSYRLGGGGGGGGMGIGPDDEEFHPMIESDPYSNPRRRKTLPSAPPNHNSAPSFDGYGHIGIPDPRAPAFIPGTGYR